MLEYFFAYDDIPETAQIKHVINKKKKLLNHGNFYNSFAEVDECTPIFNIISEYSKKTQNEHLANSSRVVKEYLILFCNLSRYFELLLSGKYKSSWDVLQNCLDNIIFIGRYVEPSKRFDISEILDLLLAYERLYPYHVFASSEMIITKSHCSICGNSLLSLNCNHLVGNLYWGELACEVVDDMKFQAVALVSHPLDKRCVMELSEDKRSEVEKFALLHDFVQQTPNLLFAFDIDEQKSIKQRKDIVVVGRNDPCSCGSGKKFKKCCYQDLNYEHVHYKLTVKSAINLLII